MKVTAPTVRWLTPSILALLLAQGCGGSSSPQPAPFDLSGTWLLNPGASEVFEDRAGDGERSGAVSIEERRRMQQQVEIGIRAFRAFRIEQSDSTVTLTSAEGPKRVFHTDGRQVERRIEGLGNVRVRARWDDSKLKVSRLTADGIEIEETYELAEGGRRLQVRFKVKGAARSFDMKRVYERVGGAG